MPIFFFLPHGETFSGILYTAHLYLVTASETHQRAVFIWYGFVKDVHKIRLVTGDLFSES